MARIDGTAAADVLTGTADADQIYGYGGDDRLLGRDGNDALYGGAGSDTLEGEAGADRLIGGAGRDLLYGGLGNDILNGGAGADRMLGSAGDDVYIVDTRDDTVLEIEGAGFDRVIASNDFYLAPDAEIELLTTTNAAGTSPLVLAGNQFAQTMIGNAGDNVLYGYGGGDILRGLGGRDLLMGSAGRDWLYGGAGNDQYWVHDADDVIVERVGEGDNDIVVALTSYRLSPTVEIEELMVSRPSSVNYNLTGNGFDQWISGSAGKNILNGMGGDDALYGYDGNDRLIGGLGKDELRGGIGDDILYVDNAGDTVVELVGEGNDRVVASTNYAIGTGAEIEFLTTNNSAGAAAIHLSGNAFAQTIIGNAGANGLNGLGGDDVLRGMGGADRLDGGFGKDTLDGGAGNDLIIGGAGKDLLRGGAGKDAFLFDTAPGGFNVDSIADFSAADDTIRLDDSVFAALSRGALAAAAFKVIGAGAIDGNDRIIYNASTGALFYDADGSGTAYGRVQFAALTGAPTITAADFLVI